VASVYLERCYSRRLRSICAILKAEKKAKARKTPDPSASSGRVQAAATKQGTEIRHEKIMILLLDNYDSFTYNLAQYLGQMGQQLAIHRNDKITLDEIAEMQPERIVISPGPCTPQEAGISIPLIQRFAGKIPILGVCLGHQALGAAFGGRVIRAPTLMHGKTSLIHHDAKTIFRRLPQDFQATRYHSLIVERRSLPRELEISAETDGIIMGLRHRKLRVEGVQFHPESVLTDVGFRLVENFLSI
jgi:anthranilate synthase/aminodeoxychorismate synthase-like glutamine amidotransferase